MSIFNSLGSNYDFNFVARSLFAKSGKGYGAKLVKLLEERYGGKAVLTYKGREAIRLALRACDSKGVAVGVCGFTCIAVYDAIKEEGYNAHFLDLPPRQAGIEKDELNFTAENLKNAVDKNPELRIVIVQNTLGYPCEIEKIVKFCRERKIILIEDLAHSIGAKYKSGQEAGAVGDFTILSFSQDKMIDGVSGGALIARSDKFPIFPPKADPPQADNFQFPIPSYKIQFKDRLYPLFTYSIRKTYKLGIGKVLHFFLEKTDLLSKPVDSAESHTIHGLPLMYYNVIHNEFLNLPKNLEHRKKIATIYNQNLNKKIISKSISSQISSSSNLRFPIFVENRKGLINYLKNNNIFVSDIWYDAPVSPKKKIGSTSYQIGNCPSAENISDRIINLPTHKNVSEKDAELISKKINIWLTLQ